MSKALPRDDQAQAHHVLMSKPLNAFKEEDLSYGLLNALFWHHDLNGDAQLKVGQVIVHKRINRFKHSATHSQDYTVSFSWTSSNGTIKEVSREDITGIVSSCP